MGDDKESSSQDGSSDRRNGHKATGSASYRRINVHRTESERAIALDKPSRPRHPHPHTSGKADAGPGKFSVQKGEKHAEKISGGEKVMRKSPVKPPEQREKWKPERPGQSEKYHAPPSSAARAHPHRSVIISGREESDTGKGKYSRAVLKRKPSPPPTSPPSERSGEGVDLSRKHRGIRPATPRNKERWARQEVQGKQNQQDQTASSASSPEPAELTIPHGDYKSDLKQYLQEDVRCTFPDLHRRTYVVPPVLFNISKGRHRDGLAAGSLVIGPGLESDTRAAEAMERFLDALQDMTSSADSITSTTPLHRGDRIFVVTGFIFEEYLHKRPPEDLFLRHLQRDKEKGRTDKEEVEMTNKKGREEVWMTGEEDKTKKEMKVETTEEEKREMRTEKRTERKRRRDFLPFPRPMDLGIKYHRGDVDVLIVDKTHGGILMVEVKAVGDNLYENSMGEPLERVRKTLKKALQMLRKQREVIRHIVSDFPCGIAVSAMLVLPNLRRDHMKAALDADPELKQDMEACLLSGHPVEDACLCADDLPAKHSSITDDDARRFSLWWGQHNPLKHQGQAPLEDDVYEEIVGRLVGPLSAVKIVARQPLQKHQQPQRPEVRTLGQAVAETARRFSTQPLQPQLEELVLTCREERVLLVGPPGSGKSVVLVQKGARWAKEGRLVCVLSRGGASSPVAVVIHDQIKQWAENPGRIILKNIQCGGHKEQLQDRLQDLVGHLRRKARGKRIGFIVDELHSGLESKREEDDNGNDGSVYDDDDDDDEDDCGDLIDVISCLCLLAPDCGFWCAAGCRPSSVIPPHFSVKRLHTTIRCPPAVQVLLKMTDPSRNEKPPAEPLTSPSSPPPPLLSSSRPAEDTYVTHSTELAPYCLPTTGPRVKLVSHDGHSATPILDCGQCADKLARYLQQELRIGEDLEARDVVIVTADERALSDTGAEPSPRFARELRERGLDVKVIPKVKGQERELASPSSRDEVVLTGCKSIRGLERKVVIFLPGGTPNARTARNESDAPWSESRRRVAGNPDVYGSVVGVNPPSDNVHSARPSHAEEPHNFPLRHDSRSTEDNQPPNHRNNKTDPPRRIVLQAIENREDETKKENTLAGKRSKKQDITDMNGKRDDEVEDTDTIGHNGIAGTDDGSKAGEGRLWNFHRTGVHTPGATNSTADVLVSTSSTQNGDLPRAEEGGSHLGSCMSYESRLRRAVEGMSQDNQVLLWHAASRAQGHAVVFHFTQPRRRSVAVRQPPATVHDQPPHRCRYPP